MRLRAQARLAADLGQRRRHHPLGDPGRHGQPSRPSSYSADHPGPHRSRLYLVHAAGIDARGDPHRTTCGRRVPRASANVRSCSSTRFKNALIPVITIAGLDLGALMGGPSLPRRCSSRPGDRLIYLHRAINARDHAGRSPVASCSPPWSTCSPTCSSTWPTPSSIRASASRTDGRTMPASRRAADPDDRQRPHRDASSSSTTRGPLERARRQGRGAHAMLGQAARPAGPTAGDGCGATGWPLVGLGIILVFLTVGTHAARCGRRPSSAGNRRPTRPMRSTTTLTPEGHGMPPSLGHRPAASDDPVATSFRARLSPPASRILVGVIAVGHLARPSACPWSRSQATTGAPSIRSIMRVADVFFAFPYILFVLLIVSVLGRGSRDVFIAIGLLSWATTRASDRGSVLSVKAMEFVEAAQRPGGARPASHLPPCAAQHHGTHLRRHRHGYRWRDRHRSGPELPGHPASAAARQLGQDDRRLPELLLCASCRCSRASRGSGG